MSDNFNSEKVLFEIHISDYTIYRSIILIGIGILTIIFTIGCFLVIFALIKLFIDIINASRKVEIYNTHIKVHYTTHEIEGFPRSDIINAKFKQDFFDKWTNTGILYINTKQGYIKFGRVDAPRRIISIINGYVSNPDFEFSVRKHVEIIQPKSTPVQSKEIQNKIIPSTKNENGNIRGEIGEERIVKILNSKDIPGYRMILKNLYVPCGYNGEKTEIDVLMIHERGLYVFESKNYTGKVYGTKNNKNWYSYYYGGEKHLFYNPIKQNQNHISSLKSYLDFHYVPLYSFIVFGHDSDLRKIPKSNNNCVIIRIDYLLDVLNNHINKSNIVLLPSEIDSLYNKLVPLTKVSEIEKQKHIERVNKISRNY